MTKKPDGPARERLEAALRRVLTFRGLASPAYAVAVPVVYGADGVDLLVEVRAPGIPQAGDPCFPGGHIDYGETPAQAAAREMAEELGISVAPERFLGRLPTVHTPLGSRTDLFVCVLAPEETADVRLNRAEVARLMQVPLAFFLARHGAASFPVEGTTIWGMTALAINAFCTAWKQAEAEMAKDE